MEYFYTSLNLEVHPYFQQFFNYHNWYERTPVYVFFLHIIQRQLIIQILLSAIGVVLMSKMNKLAGWLWCFYPQDIIHSFQFAKEGLLIFCVITAIFLLKNRRHWLMLVIPAIVIGFSSSGNVINSCQYYMTHGFMNNVWELWKPSFNTSISYSVWFVYIQAGPYLLLMWYFFRNIPAFSIEIFLVLLFTITYSLLFSTPRYREPLMPLVILFVANQFFKDVKTPVIYWQHYF
jgi:hypothetical protein